MTDEPPSTFLLRRLALVMADNKRLKRENRDLRRMRDRWRDEARDWKWAALRVKSPANSD